MSPQQTYQGGGGPSDEEVKAKPGMETFCAHLSDARLPTGVPDMGSATTIWQMNLVTATVVATDTMLNKDFSVTSDSVGYKHTTYISRVLPITISKCKIRNTPFERNLSGSG